MHDWYERAFKIKSKPVFLFSTCSLCDPFLSWIFSSAQSSWTNAQFESDSPNPSLANLEIWLLVNNDSNDGKRKSYVAKFLIIFHCVNAFMHLLNVKTVVSNNNWSEKFLRNPQGFNSQVKLEYFVRVFLPLTLIHFRLKRNTRTSLVCLS